MTLRSWRGEYRGAGEIYASLGNGDREWSAIGFMFIIGKEQRAKSSENQGTENPNAVRNPRIIQ